VAGACECGDEPLGSITSCKLVSFSRRTLLHGVSKQASFLTFMVRKVREKLQTFKVRIVLKIFICIPISLWTLFTCSFIYGLFNDAISALGYVASCGCELAPSSVCLWIPKEMTQRLLPAYVEVKPAAFRIQARSLALGIMDRTQQSFAIYRDNEHTAHCCVVAEYSYSLYVVPLKRGL
jgi:hypothetical protein